MAEKIRVLFMSDYGDTGFGTVGKELCKRLAEMDIFDVHYLGWHAVPSDVPRARANGYTLHTTRFWQSDDQFGKDTLGPLIQAIQPQVVLTLGDPWMIDHVTAAPNRDSFQWLAYIPIDRDVLSLPWVNIMKKPDCLVLYSQFGLDVVKGQIPFRDARLILHGVDRMIFRPLFPNGTDKNTPYDELMAERKRVLGEQFMDKFIVGFVGRNQIRKGIPFVMKAFKAFNCATWINRQEVSIRNPETNEVEETHTAEKFCREKQCFRCDLCPAFQQRPETEKSIVYLHTTRGDGKSPHDRPGIGWRIDELGHRLNLHGRVALTPNLDILRGLPREGLSQLMQAFDVHLFLSHSEGYGLPVAETLACGVPTLVTNYSSMPELVSGGGGVAIDVRAYDTFTTWENEWAIPDIGHAADEVNKVFADKEYAAQMRRDAAANQYTPDWGVIAKQFRELILESVGQGS
jgi:glycosyltransferase involved in cell wall biosynthesis